MVGFTATAGQGECLTGFGAVVTYQCIGDGTRLGIVIDSQLTLSAQVAAVCRSGYYQLRQLRPLIRSMSSDAVKMLVQVFISCRLDYCNSFFYGICDGLMTWLQSVQNAAACVVSGAQRHDHITPVFHQLHWLPVQKWVDFKVATLVDHLLSGMAPAYPAAECQLVSDEGRHQLHSAESRTCVVRWTYSNFGDRCLRLPAQSLEQPSSWP